MWNFLRRISLTWWICVGMVLGVALGVIAREVGHPEYATALRPISTTFLRMIKSIIVPIIFGTLVVGIAGHGDDMKRVGRLALKSLIYFEIVTTLALFIGLFAVNFVKPGIGVSLKPPTGGPAGLPVGEQPTFASVLEHILPQSFFVAAFQNQILQIVFWSVLFAIGLSQVRGRPKEAMLGFCEGLAEVMFRFTAIVMKFAPIGIGAAIAYTVGHAGLDVLKNLALLIITLYGALVVFGLLVLYPVTRIARVPLVPFVRAIKEPALIAFSTTSSEAALPKAMEQMEAIGVPRRLVAS